MALAILWSLRPLAHDDVFWHLCTSDWILQHRAVPTTDPFSYTRFGAPWISHEWGFAMLAGLWNRLFGLGGMLALTAVTLLVAGALTLRRAIPPGGSLRFEVAGPLAGIALLACGTVLFLRPALVAAALLAAFLLALDRFRQSGRRVFLLIALGVLWVWANTHSSVVFGLALLAVQTAEAWLAERSLARWRGVAPTKPWIVWLMPAPSRPGPARDLAWTLLAALGLSLCNPNGVRALLYPWVLRRVLWGSGIAWDLAEFEPPSWTSNLPLLLLGLLLALVLLRSGGHPSEPTSERAEGAERGERAWQPWEAVASLAYFGLALRATRFAPEFVVVALPLLVRALARRSKEAPRLLSWTAVAIGAVLALTLARALPARPLRIVSPAFPEGAVRFLRSAGLTGRFFHNSNQGGFLLWSLGQPVFWDGRSDVFASLTREVTTIPFPEIAERYGVDALLLGEREIRDLRAEAEGERWGLVYWDDTSAVYLRRDGPLGKELPRLELQIFHALSDGKELIAIAGDPTRRPAARAELARLLAEQPENRRALYFAAVLDLSAGDAAGAQGLLRAASELGGADAGSEAVRNALALAEAMAAKRQGGGS